MRKLSRPAATLTISAVLLLVVAVPARADITTTSDAPTIAAAIASGSATPTGAGFETIPEGGTPNAVSDSSLAGFPTDGETFGILTTGDASLADDADDAEDSGADLGSAERGAFDVSILRIDLTVPEGADCLRFDFRFLSEEYPEFVGQEFNDGFLAELDTSDWEVVTEGETSSIVAPNNFAVDSNGDHVSINNSGVVSMTEANAAGTTYDGATPQLKAQTPIGAGEHSLFLSIFDAGDGVYDSAAFVDNLTLGTTTEEGCEPGVITEPGPDVDLAIDKIDEPDPVTAGNGLRYSISVTNVGEGDATAVHVDDQLPAGTTFVAAAGDGWTCSHEGGVVSCDREGLAAGESAPPIEIDVTAPTAPGTITNTAQVSSTEEDADTEDNETSEDTSVEASSVPDHTVAFCPAGCTVTTNTGGGATPDDPTFTTLIVPDEADPQTVRIDEFAASIAPAFCGGATCSGQIVEFTDITGVTSPTDPIVAKFVYDKTVKGGTQMYILKPGFTQPRLIKNCTTPGIASPHPCVSSKVILPNGDREVTVLLLSGDPIVGKR